MSQIWLGMGKMVHKQLIGCGNGQPKLGRKKRRRHAREAAGRSKKRHRCWKNDQLCLGRRNAWARRQWGVTPTRRSALRSIAGDAAHATVRPDGEGHDCEAGCPFEIYAKTGSVFGVGPKKVKNKAFSTKPGHSRRRTRTATAPLAAITQRLQRRRKISARGCGRHMTAVAHHHTPCADNGLNEGRIAGIN